MSSFRFFLLIGAFCPVLPLVGCSGGSSATTSTGEDPSDVPENIVVATYGDSTLTLSEFERAYVDANNRPPPAADSLAAYQEFLEQYVNYRLKVRAARAAGLDTLSSVRKEVRSYRYEMARPKVMRSQIYEPLTRSLYERRQQEVDVSHILSRVEPDAAPEDTLEAYREMQAIADSIERGRPFAELAYRNSEDPSAQKKGERGYKGRLGYIRAGQIVKPFEDRMYSLPPDSVSDIFRTQFGYHILKVHDRRPTQPPIRLSHVMVRPQGDSTRPRQLLDSLRIEIVRNGADFAAVTRQYSEDRRSASEGGDLGKIESTQTLPPSFRKAVARLDSVGAVSEVVKSQFGYHLIKLTDRETQPSYEDAYDDLKDQIRDRPRVEQRKTEFARQVRAEAGISVDTSRILSAVNAATVDTLSRVLLSAVDAATTTTSRVATLGDSTYTLDQVARHVMQTDSGAQQTIGEVIEDFLNEKALRFATARRERHDADFAAKMKEYREGLLVFQFMQDSVWTAAAQDTAGLRRTYQRRQDQYRYADRVRAIVLRAASDSLLTPYEATHADASGLPSVVREADADSFVTVDTVMVTDRSSTPYRRLLSVNDGAVAGPIETDGESLLLVRDTRLPARPKRFEEARSSVVQHYQDRYEDKVLARLRRRYDVKTYPKRLQRAFDEVPSSPTASQ